MRLPTLPGVDIYPGVHIEYKLSGDYGILFVGGLVAYGGRLKDCDSAPMAGLMALQCQT